MKLNYILLFTILTVFITGIATASNVTYKNTTVAVNSTALLTTPTSVTTTQATTLFATFANALGPIVLYSSLFAWIAIVIIGGIVIFRNEARRKLETGEDIVLGTFLQFFVFTLLLLVIPLLFYAYTTAFPLYLSATFSTIKFAFNSLIVDTILLITVIFSFVGFILFFKAVIDQLLERISGKRTEFDFKKLSILFIGLITAPFLISFIFLVASQDLIGITATLSTSFSNVTISSASTTIIAGNHVGNLNACAVSPNFWSVGKELSCYSQTGTDTLFSFIYPFTLQAGIYGFVNDLLVNSYLANAFTSDLYDIVLPILLIWSFAWIDYLVFKYLSDIGTKNELTSFHKLKTKIWQYVFFIISPFIFIFVLMFAGLIVHLAMSLLFSGNFSPIPVIFELVTPLTVTNTIAGIAGFIGIIFAFILLVLVALLSLFQLFAGPIFILGSYWFASDKPQTKEFGKRMYEAIAVILIIPIIAVALYTLWFGLLPGVIATAFVGHAQVLTGTAYGYTLTGSGTTLIMNGAGINNLQLSCSSGSSISSAITQISQSPGVNAQSAYSALTYGCSNSLNSWASGILIIDSISLILLIVAILLIVNPAFMAAVPGFSTLSTSMSSLPVIGNFVGNSADKSPILKKLGSGLTNGIGKTKTDIVKSFTDEEGFGKKLAIGAYNYTKAPLVGTTEGAILEGAVATGAAFAKTGIGAIKAPFAKKTKGDNEKTAIEEAEDDTLNELSAELYAAGLSKTNVSKIRGYFDAHRDEIFDKDGHLKPNGIKKITDFYRKNIAKKGPNTLSEKMKNAFSSFNETAEKDKNKYDNTLDGLKNLAGKSPKKLTPEELNNSYYDILETIKNKFDLLDVNKMLEPVVKKYEDKAVAIANNKNLTKEEKEKELAKNEKEKNTESMSKVNDTLSKFTSGIETLSERFSNKDLVFQSVIGASNPAQLVTKIKELNEETSGLSELSEKSTIAEKEKYNANMKSLTHMFDEESMSLGFADFKEFLAKADNLSSVKMSKMLSEIDLDKFSSEDASKLSDYLKSNGMNEKSIDMISTMLNNPETRNAGMNTLQTMLMNNISGSQKQINDQITNAFENMSSPIMSALVNIPKGLIGNLDENIKNMVSNPVNSTLKTQIDGIKKALNETWYQVSSGSTDGIVERIAQENQLISNEITNINGNIIKNQKALLDTKGLSEYEKREIEDKIASLKDELREKTATLSSNNKAIDIYNKTPIISGLIDAITEFNVQSSDDVIKRYKFSQTIANNQIETLANEITGMAKEKEQLQSKINSTKDESAKIFLENQLDKIKERMIKINSDTLSYQMQSSTIKSFLDVANVGVKDEEINEELKRLNIEEAIGNSLKTSIVPDNSAFKKVVENYNTSVKTNNILSTVLSSLKNNLPVNIEEYENTLSPEVYNKIKAAFKDRSSEVINSQATSLIKNIKINDEMKAYGKYKNLINDVEEKMKSVEDEAAKETDEKIKEELNNKLANYMSIRKVYNENYDLASKKLNDKLEKMFGQNKDIIIKAISSVDFGHLNLNSQTANDEFRKQIDAKIRPIIESKIEATTQEKIEASINKMLTSATKATSSELFEAIKHNIKDVIKEPIDNPEIDREREQVIERIGKIPSVNFNDIIEKLNFLSSNGNMYAEQLLAGFNKIENELKTNSAKPIDVILDEGILEKNSEISKNKEIMFGLKEKIKELEKKEKPKPINESKPKPKNEPKQKWLLCLTIIKYLVYLKLQKRRK